jgi:hypothetical protein
MVTPLDPAQQSLTEALYQDVMNCYNESNFWSLISTLRMRDCLRESGDPTEHMSRTIDVTFLWQTASPFRKWKIAIFRFSFILIILGRDCSVSEWNFFNDLLSKKVVTGPSTTYDTKCIHLNAFIPSTCVFPRDNRPTAANLFIRPCYQKLISIINDAREPNQEGTWFPPNIFTVQGSPGIGKTFFAYYYISQAREAGIRFVLYSHERENSQTVFMVMDTHTRKAVGPFSSDSLIITLLNNYACTSSRCVAWIKDGGNNGSRDTFRKVKTIILASSREDKNMCELDKCYYKRLYMPLWDMTEKSAAYNFPSEMEMFLDTCFPDCDKEKFSKIYEMCGPVLRNCLLSYFSPPDFGKELLLESIQNAVFYGRVLGDFKKDKIYHLFLMLDVDPFTCKSLGLTFVSHWAKEQFMKVVFSFSVTKIEQYLRWNRYNTSEAGMWQHIFESYAHYRLAKGGQFTVAELFPDNTEKENTICLPKKPAAVFQDNSVFANMTPDVYFIPDEKTKLFPTFDSFEMNFVKWRHFLRAYQISRSTRHGYALTDFQKIREGISNRAPYTNSGLEIKVYLVCPEFTYSDVKFQDYKTNEVAELPNEAIEIEETVKTNETATLFSPSISSVSNQTTPDNIANPQMNSTRARHSLAIMGKCNQEPGQRLLVEQTLSSASPDREQIHQSEREAGEEREQRQQELCQSPLLHNVRQFKLKIEIPNYVCYY